MFISGQKRPLVAGVSTIDKSRGVTDDASKDKGQQQTSIITRYEPTQFTR